MGLRSTEVVRPWWETHPQKYWASEDWDTWEKLGRPPVPREMRLRPPDPPPLDAMPPTGPPMLSLPGFSLHERPRGPRAADAVLKKFGLR